MITLVCLSIVVFCYLVVFLVLCIFVVGGVAYVYMCDFLVGCMRLCFGFVC